MRDNNEDRLFKIQQKEGAGKDFSTARKEAWNNKW